MENILVSLAGEISLKSTPVRRAFERKLRRNIKRAVKVRTFRNLGAKFALEVDDVDDSLRALGRIFGVAWASRVTVLDSSDLDEVLVFVKRNYSDWIPEGSTFAVRVRRVGEHPYKSIDVARKVGELVDRKIDLKNPDVELFIEIRGNRTYFYTDWDRIKGPDGLPLGTAGTVVCLISGGLDSPVASWMMMKRGCSVVALYAMSPLAPEGLRRFFDVFKVLREWHVGERMRAFVYRADYDLTSFGKEALRHAYVLERRIMVRVASELARRVGAKGIVTGDSLGQVSSQTLDNLYVIDRAASFPIYRPLISFDKNEIAELARRIGTYEISTRKCYQECGSLTACVRKPVTKAKMEKVLKIENKIGSDRMLENCLSTLEEVTALIR